MLLLSRSASSLREAVWFASSYLCYGCKYDYARCGMQCKALSGAINGWYLPACFPPPRTYQEVSPKKHRDSEVSGAAEHQCLTLHPTISGCIHTVTYQDLLSVTLYVWGWLAHINLQRVCVCAGKRGMCFTVFSECLWGFINWTTRLLSVC